MRYERLTEPTHRMYETALALYGVSFPPHEQRRRVSQDAILGDDAYHFDLLYDRETFVGLLLYWETETFLYVEHFCVLPELRGCGCGRQALALLEEKHKTVILEIDPPVDEVSIRRKHFYERCGFTAAPYHHVHPPYHRRDWGHELVVMSCPGGLTPAAYDAFAACLRDHVMKNALD